MAQLLFLQLAALYSATVAHLAAAPLVAPEAERVVAHPSFFSQVPVAALQPLLLLDDALLAPVELPELLEHAIGRVGLRRRQCRRRADAGP